MLDLTLPTPAENLALDEALLDWVESGQGSECLRLWEAPQPFVVLGYSDCAATEVDSGACRELYCSVLRRCTGGGAVLQAPGSLSYSLILRIKDELSSLTHTNDYVLDRHRTALAPLVGQPIELRGSTDLTLNNRKFSGNSQRRRRQTLLFHGTLLRQVDFHLLDRVLPMPTRQPEYRERRSHRDFLTTLRASDTQLRSALANAWGAVDQLTSLPSDLQSRLSQLVAERYTRPEWTNRR